MTIGFIYFFIGLFAANCLVSMLTGRGHNIDFTKKEQVPPRMQGANFRPARTEQPLVIGTSYSSALLGPVHTSTVPGKVRLAEDSPEVKVFR